MRRIISAVDEWMKDHSALVDGLSVMSEFLIESRNFGFLDSPKEDIYPFGTPFLFSEKRFADLHKQTFRLASDLERFGQWLRSDVTEARRKLIFSCPLEEEFFMYDRGYSQLLPIYRMDFVLPEQGPPKVLEINCGCPGGELDPALLARAFHASPLFSKLQESLNRSFIKKSTNIFFQEPSDESLTYLLKCYEEFRQRHPSFPESPTIALITSSSQEHFMVPENRGISHHYRRKGYRTVLGDLVDLKRDGNQVLLHGEPVHLIFRKFSTDSFRVRMEDRDRFGPQVCNGVRGIWKAVVRGEVCMVNPLGSTALQDKGILAHLCEQFVHLNHVIPETYILEPDLPSTNKPLWDEIRSGEPFILKRRRSFAGRYAILKPWEVARRAPELLRESPSGWVAQKRLFIPEFPFAVWQRRRTKLGRFPFILSPFGQSHFVRLGTTAGPYQPLGAHAGGAATFALVIGDGGGPEKQAEDGNG